MSHPRTSPFRDRVLGFLKTRRDDGATALQVATFMGEPYTPIMQCMNGLRAANQIVRAGRDADTGQQRYKIREPKADAVDPRLPMLVAGPGDRRTDCRHISACLERWCRSGERGDAHCPQGCGHYAPISKAEKLAASQRRSEPG